MKIVNDWPPNIDAIRAVLDISGVEPCFTYGDTIYNPYGFEIDLPLQAHEETHMHRQNEIGVDEWWRRYLDDPKFRADEEVKAYRVQYRKLRRLTSDRDELKGFLRFVATQLSGSMYGGCVTYEEAMVRVQK